MCCGGAEEFFVRTLIRQFSCRIQIVPLWIFSLSKEFFPLQTSEIFDAEVRSHLAVTKTEHHSSHANMFTHPQPYAGTSAKFIQIILELPEEEERYGAGVDKIIIELEVKLRIWDFLYHLAAIKLNRRERESRKILWKFCISQQAIENVSGQVLDPRMRQKTLDLAINHLRQFCAMLRTGPELPWPKKIQLWHLIRVSSDPRMLSDTDFDLFKVGFCTLRAPSPKWPGRGELFMFFPMEYFVQSPRGHIFFCPPRLFGTASIGGRLDGPAAQSRREAERVASPTGQSAAQPQESSSSERDMAEQSSARRKRPLTRDIANVETSAGRPEFLSKTHKNLAEVSNEESSSPRNPAEDDNSSWPGFIAPVPGVETDSTITPLNQKKLVG